jgi:hypothetical protein
MSTGNKGPQVQMLPASNHRAPRASSGITTLLLSGLRQHERAMDELRELVTVSPEYAEAFRGHYKTAEVYRSALSRRQGR